MLSINRLLILFIICLKYVCFLLSQIVINSTHYYSTKLNYAGYAQRKLKNVNSKNLRKAENSRKVLSQ